MSSCGYFLSVCVLPQTTALAKSNTPAVQEARRLSLAEARKIAFERNWDLLASQANVDQAIAQRLVAEEFPNPTVSFNTSKINTPSSRTNSTSQSNRLWDRSYDTVTAISELFEIGGKRSARQASAQAGAEGATAAFRDARRTLDLAVTKAYIACLLAEANVSIYQETAQSLQHEAQIAETRLNAGDISESDKAQIEIAAARSELDSEAAKANAVTAKIALDVLLGEKQPNGLWTPTESLQSLALLRGSGNGQNRPDLLAAQAAVKKAEADIRLQKAMRIPDPTLQIQYEHQPPDQPNTVGFGISFPFPIELNTGNIRAAEANRAQAQAQLGKVQGQIASEIASGEMALSEATRRWNRYEKEIQPHSADVLKTVEYSYQKGKAALLDLLAAERTNNDVRLSTAQSMADCASAAATLAIARNQPLDSLPAPKKSSQKTHEKTQK